MVVEEFLTSAVLIPWIETEMFFRTMHLWNTDSSAGERKIVYLIWPQGNVKHSQSPVLSVAILLCPLWFPGISESF